jgi:hypothetical protein
MTVLTAQAVIHPPIIRIPALIKRNTALFALSQSFTGAGMKIPCSEAKILCSSELIPCFVEQGICV